MCVCVCVCVCPAYLVRLTWDAGHCWKSKNELISDVLLCTPSHSRANVRGREKKERERERERERESGKSVIAAPLDDVIILLFSVFWPFSTRLMFGWSQFFLRFPTLLISFLILCGLFQNAPIAIGITVTLVFFRVFSVLWQSPKICLSFRFLLFSPCNRPER